MLFCVFQRICTTHFHPNAFEDGYQATIDKPSELKPDAMPNTPQVFS